MNDPKWTPAEQRAIDANPDLSPEVAAAFADDLNEMADTSGIERFSDMLGIPRGEGHPPAEPGSVQELFPHLRDPRFV